MKIKHDKRRSQIDSIEYGTNFVFNRINPQLVTTPHIKRVRVSSGIARKYKIVFFLYLYLHTLFYVRVYGKDFHVN